MIIKQRIVIIVSSFILILGITIGGFWIVQRSPKLQNTVAKLANVTIPTTTTTNTTNTTNVAAKKNLAEVQAAARIFTERYGSTSNQDPAALAAVIPYSSSRLATILTANMNDLIQRQKPDVTVVISTKVYVVTPRVVTADSATVLIDTVREETVGGGAAKQTKQPITLQLVREKNAWLVDQAQWGEAVAYGS